MHFNKGYIDFFSQLDKNNNKEWFRANKKWYELAVREPFKELIDELLPEIMKLDEGIHMESKDALFRINRDLRFSDDKTPYKTHMAAGFSRGGRKSQYAGFYLEVGLKHIIIGGGLPYLEKDALRKIRIEIGFNEQAFQRILENAEFKSQFGFLHGENEKEVPKTFIDISQGNPLIANKQFYYGALFKTEKWLFQESLPEHILEHFRVGLTVNKFLINAIGSFARPVMPKIKKQVPEF